jgi:hypothetical protein
MIEPQRKSATGVTTVVVTLSSTSLESLEKIRDSLVNCNADLIIDGPPEKYRQGFGSSKKNATVWRLYGSIQIRNN